MGDEDRKLLGTSVPTDSAGFVRLECASCGLEFKLESDEEDRQDSLAMSIERLYDADRASTDDHSEVRTKADLYCPYCSHSTNFQGFIHPEIHDYLIRQTKRELVEPMIEEFLDSISQMFNRTSSSRSLISIRAETTFTRSQRPMCGPEPDDMVSVRCLGCRNRFKVRDSWIDWAWCPNCGVEIKLQ